MSKFPGRIISNLAPAGYSVYFDGTGDYLSVANNAALNVGSGDFCIEAWFNVSTVASQQSIVSNAGASGSDNTQIDIVSGNIRFASSATVWLTGSAVTTNTWNHVVLSRSGTTMSLFLNGSRQATATNSTNFANANNYATIVGGYPPSTAQFTGYISNVRIVKGSSVYDPTQTTLRVPTQLLNITNTSLLTCQSPAIIDNSTNNFTITANGNAAVSTLTPFTAYVPYNPALGASTPGVWTVDEAMQAAATRQWNMYDPYFNLTTLLLHGNGTNGAQNNTFLDSSSNNFTITRNGNTTQGSYSPFSQTGWGNYFISPNYLRIAYNAAFLWSTGARTFEAWVYLNSTSSNNAIFGLDNESSSNTWELFVNTSGQVVFRYYNGASQTVTTTSTVSTNAWTHIAFTYDGTSVITLYINGVSAGTGTKQGTPITDNNPLLIAHTLIGLAGNAYFNGYISNVRFTSAVVYTGNFTPSTTPLTAITNTSLLTCQSNRFVDNSTNTFAITVINTPSVQPFSPFLPTVAYTPQTIGGSGYFDGTGDFLAPTANLPAVSTGQAFTLEMWVYAPAAVVNTNGAGLFGGISNAINFVIGVPSTNNITYGKFGVANIINPGGACSITPGSWNHLVLCRNTSNQTAIFVNGTRVGSEANDTNSFVAATYNIANNNGNFINAYISSLRFVVGTAVYNPALTTLTVPTAPLTNITNTSLLLNFTNAGVVDSTADNVFETAGNAQISTTQSKFGGSSMFFDGSTGRLITPNNQLFNFGASDFTIEGWFYTGSSATMLVLYSTLNQAKTDTLALQFSGGTAGAYASAAGGGVWGILNGTNMGTLTLNAWNHVALVRSGSTWNGYVNGIRGSGFPVTNSSALAAINGFVIGEAAGAGFWYSGYIDDFRITRFARYTGNFTPQTSQWQDQ